MRAIRTSQAVILAFAVLCAGVASAQDTTWAPQIQALKPRNIGPTSMGGRVTNFAVYEKEPRIFYVATAGGGLWKTTSAGTKFAPVFQYESSVALGAVTVDQDNPDIVWVGTGEENSRNSTSWGDGVYKSIDGGKTWEHLGLENTQHISAIRINPKNKDIVYVSALGKLWGPSEDRGIYKSTNGGKTWSNVLKAPNDMSGSIELLMDPRNPDVLIAAMWEKKRTAYSFASGGAGGGIYKSTDGGKNWKKLSKGLPDSDYGRIGISRFNKNPDVLIASIESKENRGVYKSTDNGDSWTFLNNINPRPFYFSTPMIDPVDENRIYLPAVNFHYSDDGGKTFKVMQSDIHVDYHAIWINPKDNNYMLVGEDGGVAVTRDRGETWEHLNNLPIGQFYAVAADMRQPYWVYGGLQDNGTWGGPTQTDKGSITFADWRFINGGDGFHVQVDPSDWRIVYAESQGGAINRQNMQTGESQFIRPRPPQGEKYRFNWSAPILMSPHNPKTIWFGGNKLFKSVDMGSNWTEASPDLTTDNADKLAPGGGVSPESTGAENHCTIITISESPMKAGVVWVGTDDGNVQLTQDDGKNWEKITVPDVPEFTWVSRVMASQHVLGRAYVCFDGHRNSDFNSYVYVTEDFGKTWTKLSSGFGKNQVAYTIVEGRKNPDLLFLGTEMGLFTSLDRGQSWSRIHKEVGFPTVRVDDLLIHPRDLDLIVATHGRSFWTMPVGALEQLTKANLEKDVFLCEPALSYFFGRVFDGWFEGDRLWSAPNTQPGTTIYYNLKNATEDKVEVFIKTVEGKQLARLSGTGKQGLNGVDWTARGTRQVPLTTGDYLVELKIGEASYTTTLRFEDVVDKN
jgi:photosystem II stability/assembly factor-like uncharacterized protein